uniref:Uncharacterized protein n=1 Tax=Arundo donax TaxID=35708 RepID=A0A0A8ZD99_ARUDO
MESGAKGCEVSSLIFLEILSRSFMVCVFVFMVW